MKQEVEERDKLQEVEEREEEVRICMTRRRRSGSCWRRRKKNKREIKSWAI